MLELNKDQVIVAGVSAVVAMASGLALGRWWGVSAARKNAAKAAAVVATPKPATDEQAA